MSANIDTMMYVGETPWHGLGYQPEVAPTSAKEIIEGANLGWDVAAEQMYTETHDKVFAYHTIYRTDTKDLLGVVNSSRIRLVQNAETFNSIDGMLGESIDFETAAGLAGGEKVFGCFKVREGYRVLDDDHDHYFVVVNDHLQVDGKVTVLNTPIRVVCENTLAAALSKNLYKVRIPLTTDEGVKLTIANNLMDRVHACGQYLESRAQALYGQKIDKAYIDGLLDELFPLQQVQPGMVSIANERQEIVRETFVSQCLAADNLGNYRGTAYQALQAVTDFAAHYYKDVNKAYDLDYRMRILPGIATDTTSSIVSKFLQYNAKKAA